MIDAAPSFLVAKELTAPALAAYLLTTGWRARPSRVDGISILSKMVPGSDESAEFILPVVSGFSDEQRRIADALRTVSALENIAMRDIALAVSALRSHSTENDGAAESTSDMRFKPVDESNIDHSRSSRVFSKRVRPESGTPIQEGSARIVKGTVKFFNKQKGFGFIAQEGGGPDVFVHISAVERAGMRTLSEGQKVEFEVVTTRETGGSTASIIKRPV